MEDLGKNYIVYKDNGEMLNESQDVVIGDIFIDKNFDMYEVYFTDEEMLIAKVKLVEKLEKHKITKKQYSLINKSNIEKNVGLYCSHNDESYITGDGYDSVYGKGGIHSIASKFAKELSFKGINTIFDETLHIPHDSYAYSRSNKTAKKLLGDYNLNALFDIHRDGASRKTYVTKYGGEERCMVRIVVGQANANKNANLEFAKCLLSVSEIVCPWLFLDIYYAKGHYNQALTNKGLLFEMGSHLVEKSLVEKTIPYLAEVVNITLFQTSINESGQLIVGGNQSGNVSDNEILDTYLENINYTNIFSIKDIILIVFFIASFIIIVLGFAYIFFFKKPKISDL